MPVRNKQLPVNGGSFLWRDYEDPTDAELDALGAEYHFHPLAIEDCKHEDQRSKVDAYDNCLFLSLHSIVRSDGEIKIVELEAFLGENYLVTTHRNPMKLLDAAEMNYCKLGHGFQIGPDFLLYLITDQLADAFFPVFDEMDDQVDALEDEILQKPTNDTLQRIFVLKQQIIQMRKTAAPMREVVNTLTGTRFALLDDRTAVYFRDVYDHLARIYEFSETSRDLLSNALDTYLSVISNRLNEIMKVLTIISTIFLPISFIAGIGGMNFTQMPFTNDLAFSILIASVILLPVGMLAYYRYRGWI